MLLDIGYITIMENKKLLFIRFIIVFIAITLGGLLMFQDAFSKAEQKRCNFHLRDDISKDDFSNLFSSMKKEGLIGRSTGYMSIGNLVMGPEEDIQKIADKARQQWGEDAVVEIKYFEPTPVPVEVTLTSAKKTYYYKEPLIFIVKIQNILKDKNISIFTGFYPEGRSVSFRIINSQKNIKYKSKYVNQNISANNFITLKPGEYKEVTYKITEYFNTKEDDYCESDLPPGEYTVEEDGTVYFPPGEYTAEADYFIWDSSLEGKPNLPDNIVTGSWSSFFTRKSVTFEILPSEEYSKKLQKKLEEEKKEKERIKPQQEKPTHQPSTPEDKDITQAKEETTKEPKPEEQPPKETNHSTLHLKDGRIITGIITKEDPNTIKINTGVIEYTISKDEIDRIE